MRLKEQKMRAADSWLLCLCLLRLVMSKRHDMTILLE